MREQEDAAGGERQPERGRGADGGVAPVEAVAPDLDDDRGSFCAGRAAGRSRRPPPAASVNATAEPHAVLLQAPCHRSERDGRRLQIA